LELDQLIEALSNPGAYPHSAGAIEIRHTHISVVFLAGEYAYKIKKPVDFGFLNFSTLERRRHFCEEELRLNRRLAPSVYLRVVGVTDGSAGLRIGGDGETIEWAVQMQRLPADATMQQRLMRGDVRPELVERLARRMAAFYRQADTGEWIAAFGRFSVVAGNARENFDQAAPQVGVTLSRQVYQRLRERTEHALTELHPLIERRARPGIIRDTHGDLHLDHVYVFPDRPPPVDLIIVDCIEFNERFRFADPVADMSFLRMDLLFHGRKDLAHAFEDAYFRAAGEEEGKPLVPFYTAYRAAVRGKVEGMEFAEPEIPQAERAGVLVRARAHWLLALGQLEEPGRRACLLLVGGLPGTGKSTLARALAESAGFTVIRSDSVRKEIAGIASHEAGATTFGQGIYTSDWTEQTYAECSRRAEALLFEGKRVLVDASFRSEAHRRSFLESARRWCVPGALLVCRASPTLVRDRLAGRTGDVSDADWPVHLRTAELWDELSDWTRKALIDISTNDSLEQSLARALTVLRSLGLYE
jgi:aminoglycoside phosphotransferase family enzyme/predicted kinase